MAFVGKSYLMTKPGTAAKDDWVSALNKAIGAKYKVGDAKMGFWAKHGRFIIGGVILILIILGVVKKVKS